jgi:hypothetical protein
MTGCFCTGSCSVSTGRRTCGRWRSVVHELGGHCSLEMTVRSLRMVRRLSCWSGWEVNGECDVRSLFRSEFRLGRVALGKEEATGECCGTHLSKCQ